MFDGISRSDPPASGSPSDGSPAGALTPEMQAFPLDGAGIHLRMDHREGRTRLTRLLQKAPMRALLPQVSAQEPPTACLTNTAGGLVGGDRFSITVEAGENAALLAMAQAAEKVYRSAGPDVRLDIALRAEAGAWLEWLPQETILFDRSRLRRSTLVEIDPSARLLAGEITVFGREAHGETLSDILLRDRWRVCVGGRAVWGDALAVDGPEVVPVLAASAGFGGATASGLILVHVPEDQRDGLLEALLDLDGEDAQCGLGPALRLGASQIGPLLILRFLARDPAQLRVAFARRWAMLRQRLAGYAPRLPRLWYV